jgi:hypothetical protein
MSIRMNQSKSLNLKVQHKRYLKYLPISLTYLPTYLIQLVNLSIDLNSFWPKFKKYHMYHAICHNIKPFKIEDDAFLIYI